jgi:hypothetical protein
MEQLRPAPIRTNESNPFARYSMQVRVPKIIEEVQALNPDYPVPIQQALSRLRDSLLQNEPMPLLDLPAPDYDDWAEAFAQHAGETWLNTEWFFSEIYVYRLMVQATRWWQTQRDLFAPFKDKELSSDSLWKFLDLALSTREQPMRERLTTLLHYSLWSNRIDLSYKVAAAHGSQWVEDDLIADNSVEGVDCLLNRSGIVHLICDNAGTEMALDLALIDALLDGVTDQVISHLKVHPLLVSDAMVSDVLHFLNILESGEHGEGPRELAKRLRSALVDGRWQLAPDLFWNSPKFLWELPTRLIKTFEGARLVILKGDANYRRATGDAMWPPETPFAEVTAYFPPPLLAMRTLKSDSICGLAPGLAQSLDALDKDWRRNGRRGVIQGKW